MKERAEFMRTPYSMLEAIQNAISLHNIDAKIRYLEPDIIDKHIKDFISQHFTAFILNYPESEKILMDLFTRITRKKREDI